MTPPLYHLGRDPGEQFNIAEDHPEVLDAIRIMVQEHRDNLEVYPDQLVLTEPAE